MYHKTVIFSFVLFFSLSLAAQFPLDEMEKWKRDFPLEKIYLHTDRDSYRPGDTIWFKAYLSNEYLPDTLSTILYTELWSSKGVRIVQQTWPVLFGTSYGQFELPDSCSAGEYMLKAWTSLMLNAPEEFIYKKYFRINSKKASSVAANGLANTNNELGSLNKIINPPPQFNFFPEGGNLVEQVSNSVAFEVKDRHGKPLAGFGKLVDEQGNLLSKFSATKSGRGILEWTPMAGKKYFVQWDADSTQTLVPLPEANKEGVALTLVPHAEGWYFEIKAGGSNSMFSPAYMIGQQQHEIVFNSALSADKKKWQGIIKTKSLGSGILQLTVFNKDHMPLAERLCFVNNKEYYKSISLHLDTISFEAKSFNHLRLSLTDTVKASLSVSVTDATHNSESVDDDNIISSLLLTGDWPARIDHAASYFNSDTDSTAGELDLLMMTKGWRRFSWKQIMTAASASSNYKDPGFITLEGTALLKGTKKPFANKELLVIMGAIGKGQNTFITTTDNQGKFRIDSLLFQGNVRFYFMEPRGKKSQYIDVRLLKDTIPVIATVSSLPWEAASPIELQLRTGYDSATIDNAEGNLLEEVTIEVKKKSSEQLVDERYSSGMFAGFATRTIDLVSNDQMVTEPTIFDYLIARVPGLSFTANGPDYVLYYRQGPSASSMGPIPMTIFLNEVETDATLIAAIPPNDIALVKIFNTFVGAFGNGAGGAMAIYTKKGTDITKSVARGDMITYRGFTIRKEFASLDYRALKGSFLKPDKRLTLLWKPAIFINNVNPTIPLHFYNNDSGTSFRIRVEGMTTDGKLIYLNQLIQSKKP